MESIQLPKIKLKIESLAKNMQIVIELQDHQIRQGYFKNFFVNAMDDSTKKMTRVYRQDIDSLTKLFPTVELDDIHLFLTNSEQDIKGQKGILMSSVQIKDIVNIRLLVPPSIEPFLKMLYKQMNDLRDQLSQLQKSSIKESVSGSRSTSVKKKGTK